MLSFLKKLADVSNTRSLSNKFRSRRFKHFLEIAKGFPRPVRILDIGGTQSFWEQMKFTSPGDVHVTIINNEPEVVTLPNFTFIPGDTSELNQFSDWQFDICFSNSVIEHLSDIESQKKMACEVKRIGQKYFVQTPNYYFPIEPHFLFPFFQFLPLKAKVFLLTHFDLGCIGKQGSRDAALKTINSIKLLNLKDIRSIFPNSRVKKEKFLGITKSFLITSLD